MSFLSCLAHPKYGITAVICLAEALLAASAQVDVCEDELENVQEELTAAEKAATAATSADQYPTSDQFLLDTSEAETALEEFPKSRPPPLMGLIDAPSGAHKNQ